MSRIKVLMIGPGKPNSGNSGLGIVAKQIEDNLKSMVDLTVVEPDTAIEIGEESARSVTSAEGFSESRVVKDMVRLTVNAKIDPYFYYDSETGGSSTSEQVQSEVVDELDFFTKQVVTQGQQQKFDIIYAHDWPAMPAGLQLKKLTGKPLVLHIHSLDVDRIAANHQSWVFDIEQEAINNADAIITVSKYSASNINRIYGGDLNKITVIYPAVSMEISEGIKSKPLDPTVLFLGRFSNQKGPFQFVKIAEAILKKRQDIHFLMVGDGDLKEDVIEVVAQKGLSGNIHFNDFINHKDIGKVYSSASLLCMPSYSDPYGLVAVEAAMSGLPVVLSKQTGAAEVLPGAVVVNNSSILGFARAITKLIDDQKYKETKVSENSIAVRKLEVKEAAQDIVGVFSSLNI